MERAGTAGCALFFYLPLISGSSAGIGIGSNYSNLPELSVLLCQTTAGTDSASQSGCAVTTRGLWHRPHVRQTRCSTAPLNRSTASSEFPSYEEKGKDSSVLVSPLLVAGVVIGLVLLLSCATIVLGSLRKAGRLRQRRRSAEPGHAPDGFSHGGSSAELRSTCTEEFPQACDFGSYLDILSQVSIMYPDPPPRYDECVGPGATQIYIPTDDPPPYSLMDPCQRNEISVNIYISQEEEAASGTPGQAANSAVRLQDLQQPIPSISVISHPGGCAPLQVSGV